MLDGLDRLAMLACAIVKPSTPTEGMRVIYDLIPCTIFLKKVALASFVKHYDLFQRNWRGNSKNKTYNTSHLLAWENEVSASGIKTGQTDLHKTRVWEREFIVDTTSFDKNSDPPRLEGHSIYTDGSLANKKVGSGLIAYYDTTQTGYRYDRLNDDATVFQAEVWALNRAANFVTANWGLYENRHLVI